MKKQILTLMLSVVVFATSPVFGMDEDEGGRAAPKASPIDPGSEKVKNAEEKYNQAIHRGMALIHRRMALHRRFIHEKIDESDEKSLRGRLAFLEEFYSVQSQFQYTLKHTPSGRAAQEIVDGEWTTPDRESSKLLQKIRGEIKTIRELLSLQEQLNAVVQRRAILDDQMILRLPNRDLTRLHPLPGSYIDNDLRKVEEDERTIKKEIIELQKILRGEKLI